jgi:hypothetical protein
VRTENSSVREPQCSYRGLCRQVQTELLAVLRDTYPEGSHEIGAPPKGIQRVDEKGVDLKAHLLYAVDYGLARNLGVPSSGRSLNLPYLGGLQVVGGISKKFDVVAG